MKALHPRFKSSIKHLQYSDKTEIRQHGDSNESQRNTTNALGCPTPDWGSRRHLDGFPSRSSQVELDMGTSEATESRGPEWLWDGTDRETEYCLL